MLRSGEMDLHLQRLRQHHGQLCKAAVEALQPAVSAGLLRMKAPAGSLYLWCKLLFPADPDLLFATLGCAGTERRAGRCLFTGRV